MAKNFLKQWNTVNHKSKKLRKPPKEWTLRKKKKIKQENSPSHIYTRRGAHFSTNHIQTAENQWQREIQKAKERWGKDR